MVLEDTLESPLDCKELKPVNPKGNQSLLKEIKSVNHNIKSFSPKGNQSILKEILSLISSLLIGIKGEGNGTPLQYYCLENPMDGGAWWAAVHGVANSQTRLSDFTFTFMRWIRKWQPTPVFLPGESQGWRSLESCRLWGHTESDTTEAT